MTAEALKALRARLGLTQVQMAEMLGIGRARLSELENGANISVTIERLCEAFADGWRPMDWPD